MIIVVVCSPVVTSPVVGTFDLAIEMQRWGDTR